MVTQASAVSVIITVWLTFILVMHLLMVASNIVEQVFLLRLNNKQPQDLVQLTNVSIVDDGNASRSTGGKRTRRSSGTTGIELILMLLFVCTGLAWPSQFFGGSRLLFVASVGAMAVGSIGKLVTHRVIIGLINRRTVRR
jgi:hypothetical protein